MGRTDGRGPRVLVIVDDPKERTAVKAGLAEAGYDVRPRADAVGVERVIARFAADVVVAAVALKRGPDGLEIAHVLRPRRDIGVILLAATDASEECLAAFAAGSDDYLKRPFSTAELVARTGALLRRLDKLPGGLRRVGDLLIDETASSVSRDGAAVPLTATEYDLLLLLVRDGGHVLSKAEILDRLCGASSMTRRRPGATDCRKLLDTYRPWDV